MCTSSLTWEDLGEGKVACYQYSQTALYGHALNTDMNLCFKNLGIMNLCTSARESWITRLWEKLNKIHVWINCVRSRECRIWLLRESNFQKFFRGTFPWTPLYNWCNRGWQSACFTNNLVLNVQWQKNSMPRQNLNSCRNHESLRQKRQESWISRFKWFRFYPQ